MNLPMRKAVRARSAIRVEKGHAAAPVPEAKTDKVLIALHHRPEMTTEGLAVMLATMPALVSHVLQSMLDSGLIESTTYRRSGAVIVDWKLTTHGAKQAVFALHRDRKARPKTTFIGGINPWTGAKMRK